MAENEHANTVIGADSHFKGELTFERQARVDGRFDGKITGKGELHVSQNANCQADIEAGNVTIDGTIEGNLDTKNTIRLNANGVVRGDITAGKMVMAEGASFYGQCAVGPDAQQRDTPGPGGPSNKPTPTPTPGGASGNVPRPGQPGAQAEEPKK